MVDREDLEFQAVMKDMAGRIDGWLNGGAVPKPNGFVLFTFPFDGVAGARVNYISNARRDEMVVMVQEWLDREKARRGN